MEGLINIDIDNNQYILKGNVSSILENRRLLFSFKRLNLENTIEYIKIPFDEKNKINILQEIQDLLIKFGYKNQLGDEAKSELKTYNNEQKNFLIFSENAKKIRNNEFQDNPELIKKFKKFKYVLETKLVRKLYPLQLLSAFHMAFSLNSCNFAVPGAGKTSIVYGAYSYLKSLPVEDPSHVDKILVIGPLSSFAPWENEYEECFGKKANCQRLSGDISITRDIKEQHLYSTSPKELTLISHAGVSIFKKEIIDFLKQNKVMVIIDEAHRIKNSEGVWGQSVVEIAREATSRVILTGTPVPNGYEDLYNLFQFIYPFKFKDILKIHFSQLKDLSKNNTSIEDERIKSFINNINPYFIRIKKKDLHLPVINEKVILVEMDESQKQIYEFIESRYIKSFIDNPSGTLKDVLNKAKLIRLRQAATNPSLLEKPIKDSLYSGLEGDFDPNIYISEINNQSIDDSDIFNKIIKYKNTRFPNKFEIIKNLLTNDIFPKKGKAIIWSIFIQNAEKLQEYLINNGIESKLLIGKIEQNDRENIIKIFNNPEDSTFNVVIANPFAVAESISLHKGCHNAIYLERDYNCSNFLQSRDRIHRVGLKDGTETNYYYLVSRDSIDEIIDIRLNEKIKRMEMIIDEEIPLFNRLDDSDETDIITSLIQEYVRKT